MTPFFPSALLLTAFTLALLLLPVLRMRTLPRKTRLILALAITMPLLGAALLVYPRLGAPQLPALLAERAAQFATLDKQINTFRTTLAAQPDDAATWHALGEALLARESYLEASSALKRAVILSKGNPQSILLFTRAQIGAANGTVTEEALRSLRILAMWDKHHPEVQFYTALYHAQHNETGEALTRLRALQSELAEDSPLAPRMAQLITALEAAQNTPPSPAQQ